jgi:hypothetical protein
MPYSLLSMRKARGGKIVAGSGWGPISENRKRLRRAFRATETPAEFAAALTRLASADGAVRAAEPGKRLGGF